jgi:hypothetical protein
MYIKLIIFRIEKQIIVMPRQMLSLQHHISKTEIHFPYRGLQQWLAFVRRKLLFLWSEQTQLDRRTGIFYIHICSLMEKKKTAF